MRLSGFRCDMCGYEYVSESDYVGTSPRLSGYNPGALYIGDRIYHQAYCDFCNDCFKKVCEFVKSNGGKIHNEKL